MNDDHASECRFVQSRGDQFLDLVSIIRRARERGLTDVATALRCSDGARVHIEITLGADQVQIRRAVQKTLENN